MKFDEAAKGSPFSPDYLTARERFRAIALERGFRLEAFAIGQTGPSGEDLTMDAAILGSETPGRVWVVSSGLHGVEGYFGSAVQCLWLIRGFQAWSIQPDETIVFLHGLDPYGFAGVRRFDENNVDLNRNFVTDERGYSGCDPLYARLDTLLNPPYPPRPFDFFPARATAAIVHHGRHRVKSAIAQGQYEYPRGLFYGGHQPSRVHGLLAMNLPRWLGDARSVLHTDFHTGLGTFGTYKILLESDVPHDRVAWTGEIFGADRVEYSEPNGVSYETRGDLGTWCRSTFPRCTYDMHCAEFGTYPSLHVISALRAENQAHHWLESGHPTRVRMKRELMEAFVPANDRWRSSAVALGVDILDRSLAAAFPR